MGESDGPKTDRPGENIGYRLSAGYYPGVYRGRHSKRNGPVYSLVLRSAWEIVNVTIMMSSVVRRHWFSFRRSADTTWAGGADEETVEESSDTFRRRQTNRTYSTPD